MTRISLFVATAIAVVATMPASAQGRWNPGRWDWSAGDLPDRALYGMQGPGIGVLLPELRDSRRGRAFVARNFDWDRNLFITVREARAANRAFLDAGGPARGPFDWTVADRAPPGAGPGGWDRGAMRAYDFRDTPRGTRMTLQEDVLFATDSTVLRPGAMDRLAGLTRYLRGNPGVRVAIDGFTDSRGTAQHNLDLSQRRAESVRAAFDQLGVTRARFSVLGHGEADPVASNATPDGMRRNRRVEITLLGRHARDVG